MVQILEAEISLIVSEELTPNPSPFWRGEQIVVMVHALGVARRVCRGEME
jgi:hypothetical protein